MQHRLADGSGELSRCHLAACRISILWTSRPQLSQVVTNLILKAQHALKDIPQPRRLSVCTRYKPAQAQLRLVISDNGPGIESS